jgi:SAM-dependent methyltransferase
MDVAQTGTPDARLAGGHEDDRDAPSHSGFNFTPDRRARIRRMEDWHFWFLARQELLFSLLALWRGAPRGRVLDLGCGTGHISRALRARGEVVIGLDYQFEPSADALEQSALSLVQADAARLPFGSSSFAAVVTLDVLEHVDDHAALREIVRILQPGGHVFLTVPALATLWSHRDQAAGHRRRYDRSDLAHRVREAGLDILHVGYFQFLLLPLVWITRRAGRVTAGASDAEERLPPVINAAFLAISRFENRLSAWLQWPLGSSLILVGRKP